MKRYLDLIPISARIHRRQHRMTLICISLAVFLVSVIFGLADMEIRCQKIQAIEDYGNWHISVKNISPQDAALIAARPNVQAMSWYDVLNYRLDEGYALNGKQAAVCGFDQSLLTDIMTGISILEGRFPEGDEEILLTENAGGLLGLIIGDSVELTGPDGFARSYTISGFAESTSMLMTADAIGGFTTVTAFQNIREGGMSNGGIYYIQFDEYSNMKKEISDIKTLFHLEDTQVGENVKLMGALGQSSNSYLMLLYATAGILFLLVLTAGIFMIAGSLNSNMAQRTEFFGMMRCLGAGKKQIIRFVRLEALWWCRQAIPLGLAASIVIVWLCCAILRVLSPVYFKGMPVFGISLTGILSGIAVGVLTVLFASSSPAKKAASVSPLTAASGNASFFTPVKKAASTRLFRVETALGAYHARADRKNFVLMTGSFALSIVLFLSFSVVVDFMHHAIRPLKPYTPDISLVSPDNTCSVNPSLTASLEANPAVRRVYGRMFAFHVPARSNGQDILINLISYEDHQMNWAKGMMVEGSMAPLQKGGAAALAVYRSGYPVTVGNTITLDQPGLSGELTVSGILSASPFNQEAGVENIICTEETFRRLTGETGYTIIDIQLSHRASDRDVDDIRNLAGPSVLFSDQRAGNAEAKGSYLAMALFIYGFLIVIALITIFNIVNSIAMSVASRTRQYGSMRAIGMSTRQLVRMITAEAATYALSGCVTGCAIGLCLNRYLYQLMVTSNWGSSWNIPLGPLATIVLIVVITAVAAVHGPVKRIHEMSIVDTISAQ